MATFDTSPLSAPNTSFTQVSVKEKPDVRGGMLDAVVKGGKIAGKAIARGAGEELSGADLTPEEVTSDAESLARDIQDSFGTKEGSPTSGALSEQTMKDAKDTDLKSFNRSFATLQASVASGTISSAEARAISNKQLKERLSNPINALFRDEFLNAAGLTTGGAGGAIDNLFPKSAQELREDEVEKQSREAEAVRNARVEDFMSATGFDRPAAETEVNKIIKEKETVERINRNVVLGKASQDDIIQKHSLERNESTRILLGDMSTLLTTDGGNGLAFNSVNTLQRKVSLEGEKHRKAIRENPTLTSTQKDADIERSNAWEERLMATVNANSVDKFDKAQVESMKNVAARIGVEAMPELFLLAQISPDLAGLYMKGNQAMKSRFLQESGEDTIQEGMVTLKALANLGANRPIQKGSVIGPLSMTPDGVKEFGKMQTDPEKVTAFQKEYRESPSNSLQSFNHPQMVVAANKGDESVKKGLAVALATSLQILNTTVISSELGDYTVEVVQQGVATPQGKALVTVPPHQGQPKFTHLNIPKQLEGNVTMIKKIYKSFEQHPWMYEYAKEQYTTPAAAFNAYMKGDLEIDVTGSLQTAVKAQAVIDKSTGVIERPQIPSLTQDILDQTAREENKASTPTPEPEGSVMKAIPKFDSSVHKQWNRDYNTEKFPVDKMAKMGRNVKGILEAPTSSQRRNLEVMSQNVEQAYEAFDEEVIDTGVSLDELQSFMAHTYASETAAGSNLGKTSDVAVGPFQVKVDTAMSLLGEEGKGVIFGPKAAQATDFDIEAFRQGSKEEQRQMLRQNEEANLYFAIAKFFEQKMKGNN